MRDDGKVKYKIMPSATVPGHYPTIGTNLDPPSFSLDTTFKYKNCKSPSIPHKRLRILSPERSVFRPFLFQKVKTCTCFPPVVVNVYVYFTQLKVYIALHPSPADWRLHPNNQCIN